jgi:molecular chaperone DnaK (HSP70)
VRAALEARYPQIKDIITHDPHLAVAKGAALYADSFVPVSETEVVYEKDELGNTVTDASGNPVRKTLGGAYESTSVFRTVTPRSYGLEANNAEGRTVITNMIFRNTEIPTSYSSNFFPVANGQVSANIKVFESELDDIEIEITDGKLITEGLLEFPPGVTTDDEIEAIFSLDKDGLLAVRAVHKPSGKSCTVEAQIPGLSADEVELKRKEVLSTSLVKD